MSAIENMSKSSVKELSPIFKSTERECPRCEAVLYQNEKEECYECLNCGYIDCGDD